MDSLRKNMVTLGLGEEDGYQPLPKGFMTKAIHDGQDPAQWSSMAVIPPISMSTTFKQDEPGVSKEFNYTRAGNPTRQVLERNLAALENGKYAFCFSSGLGATTAVLAIFNNGDHVISGDDIYGGTNLLFSTVFNRFGIEPTFVDTTDPKKVEDAIRPNTKMIWLETPTNPTMKVSDISAISTICKKHNILLVVDNTFMTPYLMRPLELGADMVMHSVTKYMNGHSDVCMGAIITNNEEVYNKLIIMQRRSGIVPSPFDCYLVNRGLKTLAIRIKQHSKNGDAVAMFLQSHPKVAKVLHPGLKSHPQHELFRKQCSGNSGMLSFYHTGGMEESKKFVKALKVFTIANSLGGAESLVALPILMSHSDLPAEELKALNITDNLIRVSVGLEDKEDLIADLKQALDQI